MSKTIGVIGAGTMGVDISIDLLLHKYKVILLDINTDILEEAKTKMKNTIRYSSLLLPALKQLDINDCEKNVRYTTDITEMKECDLIIENATEDLEIKEGIYRQLNEVCDKNVCIQVNTSCCSITRIGSFVDAPDRIIGVHYMNPVYLKKTTEVIQGFYTSERTIEDTNNFLKSLGKAMVLVQDAPGFVSNRTSHLFMNEAAFVVYNGVAAPAQVDKIFRDCFGHKMGPLETADLIGLDTVVNSLNVLYESYHESKFRCCPLLQKMVDAKHLGKKTGQGFYKYK
ncbi:3-hydroxybutyryl-CoA dehydrogenase [Clostridium cavendishii DSM 21758]|uniref:3-hydroxybutyryl-CoA dehydrogenase n=1 Tax=Clostridium cavendishii DSM 21758 TaxID=1121302 RepID=A0A1M6MTX1_9CLOT|nr:3-hydroxyacyl-CoA dehydrogenase family protein [Clostridium cavendishii]SHJ86846.1 3-hydroxybutyryl-CoA dehydrogenase [Clostridium cavendishii DSM 21758]